MNNIHKYLVKSLSLPVLLFASFTLAIVAPAAAQTLYKWVDAQGKISYSDQAPPPQAKDLTPTINTLGAGLPQPEPLGFEAQQTANKNPVVLYTAKDCAPCEAARQMLRTSGTPYTEKTISTNEDIAELNKLFGSDLLPSLTVGKTALKGYDDAAWKAQLATAGYGAATAVPKRFVNGRSEALTTPKPAAKPIIKKAEQTDSRPDEKSAAKEGTSEAPRRASQDAGAR